MDNSEARGIGGTSGQREKEEEESRYSGEARHKEEAGWVVQR